MSTSELKKSFSQKEAFNRFYDINVIFSFEINDW